MLEEQQTSMKQMWMKVKYHAMRDVKQTYGIHADEVDEMNDCFEVVDSCIRQIFRLDELIKKGGDNE